MRVNDYNMNPDHNNDQKDSKNASQDEKRNTSKNGSSHRASEDSEKMNEDIDTEVETGGNYSEYDDQKDINNSSIRGDRKSGNQGDQENV